MKPYDAIRTRFVRSPEAGAAAGFSVIFLIFAFATPDTFLSHSAISSILNSQAVPGILAIGITLLMISGEFDLSVGSILGVSSLAFLYATVNGVPVLLAAVYWINCRLFARSNQRIASHIDGYSLFYYYAGDDARVSRHSSYGYFWWAHYSICRLFARVSSSRSARSGGFYFDARTFFSIVLWIARDILRARNQSIKSRILVAVALLFVAYLVIEALVPHPLTPVKIDFFYALNGRIEPGNYRTGILWWIGFTSVFAMVS